MYPLVEKYHPSSTNQTVWMMIMAVCLASESAGLSAPRGGVTSNYSKKIICHYILHQLNNIINKSQLAKNTLLDFFKRIT